MPPGEDITYTFNWDNNLREAEWPTDDSSIEVKYDPLGNRVWKKYTHGTDPVVVDEHKYIVDITGKLSTILLDIDASTSSLTKTYIYADRQIIAPQDGDSSGDKYFYLHDRLGSVRLIVDDDGDVVKQYTYEPFGEVIDSNVDPGTPLDNTFMFTGQYFDFEIEEYYLRARQYNPAIAGFTSRDPIRGKFTYPLTLHKYLYCLNDPVNRIDPSGMTSLTEEGVVVGTGGTVAGMGGNQALSVLEQARGFQNFANFRNQTMRIAAESLDGAIQWVRVFERDLHHVVGRGWGNMATFGNNMINSFENLVSLPRGMHGQITSFFNSGAGRHSFMEGIGGTLQHAVSDLPFKEQAAWGMAVLDYVIVNATLEGFSPDMYGLAPF